LSVTLRLRITEQNGKTSTSNQRRAINHESPFKRGKFCRFQKVACIHAKVSLNVSPFLNLFSRLKSAKKFIDCSLRNTFTSLKVGLFYSIRISN